MAEFGSEGRREGGAVERRAVYWSVRGGSRPGRAYSCRGRDSGRRSGWREGDRKAGRLCALGDFA